MAPIRWLALCLATAFVLCLATATHAEDEVEVVDVRSAYLAQSLLHGHQIHVRGILGGSGVRPWIPTCAARTSSGIPPGARDAPPCATT